MMNEGQKEQFLAAIRLSRLPGVGAKRFAELITQHGSPLAALDQTSRQIDLLPAGKKAPLADTMESVEEYLACGGRGTYLGAEDYPQLLKAAPEPPPYLFFKGPLWPLDPFAVAIIGPRHPSPEGKKFAGKLARSLSELGMLVISGGAMGIDAAAHRGALATSGRTALVTATGIDQCYPSQHAALYREVGQRGCVLTELLPGTPPRRDFFPTRNRIVVGLAQALVVVEGRRKSGSASSVAHMKRLRRPIFAWTGANGNRFSLPEDIIKEGGIPLLEADAEKVVAKVLLNQSSQ